MIILSIETSCDETAVSILEATGTKDAPAFSVLGNALHSQVETHAEYGGVFPVLAKREHVKNIVPLFASAITHAKQTGRIATKKVSPSDEMKAALRTTLERENGLADLLIEFFDTNELPEIDLIAVTEGPGLEPALWVGINFARALAIALEKPIMPVNHMEGHIVSVLIASDTHSAEDQENISDAAGSDMHAPKIIPQVEFPALALLISGGHTELVQIDNWHSYKVLGTTKDDAVGEAFDKVARLLGLPYPGGPKISKLAAESRANNLAQNMESETGARPWDLPRPMLKSPDYDFSFSGLKTSVLYAVQKKTGNGAKPLTDDEQKTLAEEFENSVTEVLVTKTRKALEATGAHTLIIGGGVVANTFIRKNFEALIAEKFTNTRLFVPSVSMSTDNSVMIGVAGYLKWLTMGTGVSPNEIKAKGNLSL